MHDNGIALLGAGEIRPSQQRQVDCTGGAVARTRACSELLASSEDAAPTVDGRRPDGNATASAELAFTLIAEN